MKKNLILMFVLPAVINSCNRADLGDRTFYVPDTYIRVKSHVGVLSVNNVILRRTEELPKSGSLINVDGGAIQELILNNISAPGIKIKTEKNEIEFKL
jgi:hypothetical protein